MTGSLLVVLVGSMITCRLDKLIRPVTADRLLVSPNSLRESANKGSSSPSTGRVYIASGDQAPLRWTAVNRYPWLTLAPATGGAPDTLEVILLADTLSQVVHHDTIVITSPESPDTVRVPVTFDILPPAPELAVTPSSHADTAFAGSAVPDSFSVWIFNRGGLPLTWNAEADQAWLTLTPGSGTVPPRDSMPSEAILNPAVLPAGTQTGIVTITAPGAIGDSARVTVTFRGNPCDQPDVQPDAVVSGSIALSDCSAPERAGRHAKRYSVDAAAGDTLSWRLESADFVPSLVLLDNSGVVLDQSDDCPGPTSLFCILNFQAPASGRYVIEATTAAVGATGTFALSVVRELAPGVPEQIGQFRGDSVGVIGAGEITGESVVVFKGRITDPNGQDSVRLEVELTGALSGLRTESSALVPAIAGGQFVAVRATALQDNEAYRWRARTCDKTARCSAWTGYGDPSPNVDFYVNHTPEAPPVPTALNQYYNGTPIPPGGGTGGLLGSTETVEFRGVVADPDPGDMVALEVEGKRTNESFSGSGVRGVAVAPGGTASVSDGFAAPLLVGSNAYHWRARACDQTNRCSAWVSFGGTDGSADFTVP